MDSVQKTFEGLGVRHSPVRLSGLIAYLLTLFCTSIGTSDDTAMQKMPDKYCGVYALYGAIAALKNTSNPQDIGKFEVLLSSDYISSLRGSSNLDLERAANDLGVASKTYHFLSWRSLAAAEVPLILHTSKRGVPGKYAHWVLFLGVVNGRAQVKDGIGQVLSMERCDLLSRWDGVAIAIYNKGTAAPVFVGEEIWPACLTLGFIGVLFGIGPNVTAKWKAVPTFVHIVKSFPGVALISVLFCAGINMAPWMKSPFAEAIGYDLHSLKFPEVSLAEMKMLAESNNADLIDCRYEHDYRREQILGSKNIPINISHCQLIDLTSEIPRERRVVVFCQSRGCRFSDTIGAELVRLGFPYVSIYRDGIVGWKKTHR